MLQKVTHDGKNRFIFCTFGHPRVRTTPPDVLLKNLLQPSPKLPNDIRRKNSSTANAYLSSNKTIQLLLRHHKKH